MIEFPGPAVLFVPADRPERYAKAAERSDGVIIDLEDAVLPDARAAARAALRATTLDPATTIVRVNPLDSAAAELDLDAAVAAGVRMVMVAKAEDPGFFDLVPDGISIIALCETALGVVRAREIAAHPRVVALMWGAEDLVASLGGTASRFADGRYRDVARHARAEVLLAAGAYGKVAIDAVHLDIADVTGLADEATDAVASGFGATACIHPSQVAVIRQAYAPTAQAIADAEDVLEAAADQRGVFTFRGRMIDEPVLRHARSVLARAGRA